VRTSGRAAVLVDEAAEDLNALDAAGNRHVEIVAALSGSGVCRPMPRCGRPVL
jgi:hypothetical protein